MNTISNVKILEIFQSTVRFRRFIERVDSCRWGRESTFRKFHHFPRGCCVITSHLLARYLIRDCVVKDVVNIVHGDHPQDGGHYWVQINDLIIDITADQFDAMSEKQVIVGTSGWHSNCSIYEISTEMFDFTNVDEGGDYADRIELESAYNELVYP